MKDDKKLAKYIDLLNAEKKPKEHGTAGSNEEFDKLLDTVRRVKALKNPAMPEEGFPIGLTAGLQAGEGPHARTCISKTGRRFIITFTAAAAAAVLLFTVPNLSLPGRNVSVVHAMERAMENVRAYHGIIEVVETNELGETMTQSRREVWSDKKGNYRVEEREGFSKGLITVNNNKLQWQLRPEEEKAYLFAAFPDPYRFTFEIGSEIEEVSEARSVKEVGEEEFLGRKAIILEITPDGGQAYRLWIDKETKLPLQKETAMQNAIRMRVYYSEIEFMEELPKELLTYQLPKGYEEVNTNPEQVVTSLEEAESMTGFLPVIPEEIPVDYFLQQIAVLTETGRLKLIYKTMDTNHMVVLLQSKAEQELEPASEATLGRINDKPVEILKSYEGQKDINSIRFQEKGMEYTVFGNVSTDELLLFAQGIAASEIKLSTAEKTNGLPQIEVPYDLKVEENDQKSVDAGHSPWRLDPAFTAQVFANLLLTPEGITGEYKIPYEDIKIIENNGTEAVAEINNEKSIAGKVYLRRLIRQDETGIWTVVGYDPVKGN